MKTMVEHKELKINEEDKFEVTLKRAYDSYMEIQRITFERINRLEGIVKTQAEAIDYISKLVFVLHDIDPEDYKES